MNKMLAVVFDKEEAAYEGLRALNDLHSNGDITLYATAVIVKDASGVVSEEQIADSGPVATSLGLLSGSLVGLLAGPVGLAIGASAGALTGFVVDLDKSGIGIGFLDEVSSAMSPGKAAVLAEVEETWVTPLDSRMRILGGLVFRRLKSEVVEDQLARESAAFNAEMNQLREELAQASSETKVAVQKEIEVIGKKLEIMHAEATARAGQVKSEADAKVETMRTQMKQASESQKARVEKRISKVKADYATRSAKLEQARKLAGEALSL